MQLRTKALLAVAEATGLSEFVIDPHTYQGLGFRTPHPVIVTIRDNKSIFGYYYIPIIPLLQGGGSSSHIPFGDGSTWAPKVGKMTAQNP